jgi:hypothetical protein
MNCSIRRRPVVPPASIGSRASTKGPCSLSAAGPSGDVPCERPEHDAPARLTSIVRSWFGPSAGRRGRWLAVGTALVALLVYGLTLAPGLTFQHNGADGGDLVTAADTLGVPHPPGYPTYTLLGWLFTRVPVGTIAYRLNWLSALCAAVTVGLLCRIAQLLWPAAQHRNLRSAAAALALAFSALFWDQAVIAEVYTLLAFFAALLLWLLIRWRYEGRAWQFWMAALVLGLGLGNHLTLVFITPALLVLLWPQRRRWLRPRLLLPAAGLLAAGLCVYVYLPLAAAHDPPVNWGDPTTWRQFLWVVTARQYQPFVFGLAPEAILPRLSRWAGLLGEQFGWWGLVLVLIGAWSSWQRRRRFLLACLAWIVPLGLYAFFYDTGDAHVQLLPILLLLALWWGEGTGYVLRLVRPLRRTWKRLALVLILLLPFASLALHWQAADLSGDWEVHAYIYQALEGVAPGGLIVVRGDRPTFSLWYALYAEKQRPDVAVVSGPLLAYVWYRHHVSRLYPRIVVPRPAAGEVTVDDLVRALIAENMAERPVYATDPGESWKAWFDFVEEEPYPIYRVHPRPVPAQAGLSPPPLRCPPG